jgi:hypothetical protein
LRQRYDEISARGGTVLAICFDAPERAARYMQEGDLPFPLLVDAERRTYRAYGLERGAWWRFLLPKVALGYWRMIESGRQAQRPGEDPLQLGGDFVVDPDGRLALVHPAKDPTDRPPVATLVAAVGTAQGGERGEAAVDASLR